MAEQKYHMIYAQDRFNLPIGRIAFNNLFTPREETRDDGSKKISYGVTLLFPPDTDFVGYKEAKAKLAAMPEVVRFGEEWFAALKSPISKVVDPDTLEKYPWMANQYRCGTSSNQKPKVFNPTATKEITVMEQEQIYNGCYGVARCTLAIYNKTGICLKLIGFQKAKDGEPLGFATASADEFTPFTQSLAGGLNDI